MNNTTPTAAGVVAGAHNDVLLQALELAQRGWRILPVHDVHRGRCSCHKGAKCTSAGKHPRSTGWQKNATTDDKTIRKWFQKWPHTNYGILTGRGSGLLVLDFDKKNGGLKTLQKLMAEDGRTAQAFNSTYRVATPGGGWHLYFRAPVDRGIVSSLALLPGLDIRAEGAQVVGSGSSRSGGRYAARVADGISASVLPLLDCPPAVAAILATADDAPNAGSSTGGSCHTRERKRTQENSGIQKTPAASSPRTSQNAANIDLESLPANIRGRIRDILKSTLPTAAGTRHRQVFNLARGLRSLPGWWDANKVSCRPLVQLWQQRAEQNAADLGFTMLGDFDETWGDFVSAWNKTRLPEGDTLAGAIRDLQELWRDYQSDTSLPLQVRDIVVALGYQGDFTVALLLLCWRLMQQWPNGQFPLDVRTAGSAVATIRGVADDGQQYRTAHRQLQALCADGILERMAEGHRGQAAEYLWCGAAAGRAVGAAVGAPTWLASGQW